MTISYRPIILLLLSMLLLAGCTMGSQSGSSMSFQVTPVVVTPGGFSLTNRTSEAYPPASDRAYPLAPLPTPVGASSQGRSIGVFDSYQVALEDAQANFSPNVKLYALVPSQIMQRNLGQLPVMPGWFFKFKVEGLPREYIVLVINGQSAGVTEAEPVVQVLPLDLPIDMSAVKISSDQVLAGFLKKAPELGLTVTDPFTYDLELVNLEGQSGPVWSVYDPISLKWLYAMSATTGEELPNPRS